MTPPTKDELHAKAVAGEQITEDTINELTKNEAPEGGNPPAGGVTAMAQSIHDKQEHAKEVISGITSKPESELTKEDAAKVMSAESRAMDGIRPPKGSTSAHVQSVADHNAQANEGQEQDNKD